MKVEFEINIDDVVALNRHVLTRPGVVGRMARIGAIGLAPGVVLLAVGLWTGNQPFALMGAAYSAIYIVIRMAMYGASWLFARWICVPATMRLSGSPTGLFGRHEVSLASDAFEETTVTNTRRDKWTGVLRVDETSTHVFVFLSEALAHMIPKRAFKTPGDAAAFADKARELWHAARAAS